MTVRVGDVFHAVVTTIRIPAPKFFIVICCEDPIRFVLINTRNAVQVLGNPALGPTQVFVRASELSFLNYDSWVGCQDLFSGFTAEELEEMQASGDGRGSVTTEVLGRIRAAIGASTTIVERQKLRCIAAIDLELATRQQPV